jgi:uncharacterized protein YciI
MLYAVIGVFKPGLDPDQPGLQVDLNEHLAQPAMNVRLAGFLRDAEGRKTGVAALLEADNMERAEGYLRASPFYIRGFYERTHVAEYDLEIGRLP